VFFNTKMGKNSSEKNVVVNSVEKAKLQRKPTYEAMISEALLCLQAKNKGSSRTAIEKYIKSKYPVVPSFPQRLANCVKKGVEDGWLIQTKRSYKLSATMKQKLLKRKRSEKITVKDEEEEELNYSEVPGDIDEEGTISEVEYRKSVRKRVRRKLRFVPEE